MNQNYQNPKVGNFYNFFIDNGPEKGQTMYVRLNNAEVELIIQNSSTNYFPIRINPEVLLELGFDNSYGGIFTFREKGIMIWSPSDQSNQWTLVCANNRFEHSKVQNIHEIQNIYFSFCQSELI